MAASIRQNKVASQIQRIVATVMQRDVADPRVDGLISVTRVSVSPDLREARIYVSILAGHHPPATTLEGIRSAARHIQSEVAKALPMRYAPRLTFELDESLKKQAEILKIIDESVNDQNQPPAGPPPPE